MGLDMFLEKCNRKVWGYRDIDIEEIKDTKPTLYAELKPYVKERGKYYKWESLFEEVGYWRKATTIHNWFVLNVQDGIDDCDSYEVPKDKIEELLEICKSIKANCPLVDGVVQSRQIFKEGKWQPIYEQGKVLTNTATAEELLPTQSGFFFGSTDYDEYYMADIEETIEILTKVLAETDFDNEMIVYHSSW